MKIIAFIGLVVGIMFTGCTHTTTLYIGQDTSLARVALKLQRMSQNDDVEILLKNGQRINGRNIMVGRDSTGWMTDDNSPVTSVMNSEIARISKTNRLNGAIEGAGCGSLVGGALGYAFYKVSNGSVGHPDLSGLAIPAFAIFGAFCGAVGGVAVGGHDVILYERK